MNNQCIYCQNIEKTNSLSGKEFFEHLPTIYKRNGGSLCVARDGAGRFVLHYEDDGSMVGAQIKFCPICGRRLTDEED